jgi:RNA polymerase sigma-70 factor (ECF subfamily)
MPFEKTGVEASRPEEATGTGTFEELLESYRGGLTEYISRRTCDHHAAEDLCQEALFRAYRARHTLESPRRVKGWIYSIAFHVTVDWIRHRCAGKRSIHVLEKNRQAPVAAPGSDRNLILQEERERIRRQADCLWKLVKDLPPIYREVFELRYRTWRPIAQIAHEIGIPEGNVKIRLFRARRMLATLVACRGLRGFFPQDPYAG